MANEREDEAAVSENVKSSGGKSNAATPSKAAALRSKLGNAGRYAMLALSPIVAIAALVVAVFAVLNNKSSQEQLGKNAAAIESLSANLAASKSELDKFKLVVLKEATAQNEKLKQQDEKLRQQDEHTAKIILNITPIQKKLKISPTLEQQLQLPASAPAPTAAASHPAPQTSAPHPSAAAPAKPTASPSTHSAGAAAAPAVKSAHKPTAATHAASAAAPAKPAEANQELSPQARAMKEAIEQYNSKK